MADLERTVQIIFEAIDRMTEPMAEMGSALSGFGGNATEAAEKASGLGDSIDTIPAEVALDISLDDNVSMGLNDIQQGIADIPAEKEFSLGCDYGTVEEASNLLDLFPTEQAIDLYLSGDPTDEIYGISGAIDELPDTTQIDIEVNADDYTGILDGFAGEIDATLQEIDGLFAEHPGQLTQLDAEEWRKAIDDDMELKNQEFDAQKKLIDQQLEMLAMKNSLLESGSAMLAIDTTGLEPALEDLMMNLVQKLQVKASETLSTFLLGIA